MENLIKNNDSLNKTRINQHKKSTAAKIFDTLEIDVDKMKNYIWDVIKQLAFEPDFPYNYCNIASKKLHDKLKSDWYNVRLQHSYLDEWVWHTFVILTTKNWEEIIMDPTYSQYDARYTKWFLWTKFPNKTLEKNRTEQKEFMELQKKWLEAWVYY